MVAKYEGKKVETSEGCIGKTDVRLSKFKQKTTIGRLS